MKASKIVQAYVDCGKAVPAFNIPYLPMVKPVVQAIVDEDSIAMLDVARVEWVKFSAVSLEAVAEEYHKYAEPGYTLLHLDHIPAVDEDDHRVDYIGLIGRAISVGYESVMIDGSRLPLNENISATAQVVSLAHRAGLPCEAELGAVMGHEEHPALSYEDIFARRVGFTIPDDAVRFVRESGCDWLSVAAGNIHGAVAKNLRRNKKPEARLDIQLIQEIHARTGVPIVLHGGSGIKQCDINEAVGAGIGKINVGTEIRQAYEETLRCGDSVEKARLAVYHKTRKYLSDVLQIGGMHTEMGL